MMIAVPIIVMLGIVIGMLFIPGKIFEIQNTKKLSSQGPGLKTSNFHVKGLRQLLPRNNGDNLLARVDAALLLKPKHESKCVKVRLFASYTSKLL